MSLQHVELEPRGQYLNESECKNGEGGWVEKLLLGQDYGALPFRVGKKKTTVLQSRKFSWFELLCHVKQGQK